MPSGGRLAVVIAGGATLAEEQAAARRKEVDHLLAIASNDKKRRSFRWLEGFAEEDAAKILDVSVSELRALIDECGKEIASQIATKILIIEDEALIAEIIGEALSESGHAVHAVANAQEAIAHLSNGGRVDLLFTDINLPGELDGVGLAEQVRAANPQLPILFASGRWWRLEELQKLPNAATLRKPYSPARACEAVEMLLAEQVSGADDAASNAEAALAL